MNRTAPSLSVAHAATADSAAKADQATGADRATDADHASDAGTLGGAGPQTYLSRVAFSSGPWTTIQPYIATTMANPTLTVQTVQGGARGGTTIDKPAAPAPDRDHNPVTAR